MAEALTMPKNTILRLVDFLRTGARKPVNFLFFKKKENNELKTGNGVYPS